MPGKNFAKFNISRTEQLSLADALGAGTKELLKKSVAIVTDGDKATLYFSDKSVAGNVLKELQETFSGYSGDIGTKNISTYDQNAAEMKTFSGVVVPTDVADSIKKQVGSSHSLKELSEKGLDGQKMAEALISIAEKTRAK